MRAPTQKNATLRDIALAANVSITTVWKALGDGGDINPETRDRVRALSQRLHYKPGKRVSPAAATDARFALVMIESAPNDPAPAAAVHYLASAARTRGARLEVAVIAESDPLEQTARIQEIARDVNGLLLYGVVHHALLRNLANSGVPCVVMGTLAGDPRMQTPYGHLVGHDARTIGEVAAAALLAAGHRRIAFVSVEAAPGLWAERWLAGYRHAHANVGLLADPQLIYVAKERQSNMPANPGTRAAHTLAALSDPPTAFVVPDPETAGTLATALASLGRRPADDALVTVAAHGEEIRLGVDRFALVRAEDGPWISMCLDVLSRARQTPSATTSLTYVPFQLERFPKPA